MAVAVKFFFYQILKNGSIDDVEIKIITNEGPNKNHIT